MFIILEDFEVKNKKDDKLKLDKDVKNFIDKYINSNYRGTILLNGKWGIGKSSFINLVRERYILDFNHTRKFIFLDYWNKLNAENFYSYLYSQVRPIPYWCIKFSPLLLVVILTFLHRIFDLLNTLNFLIGIVAILISSILTFFLDHFSIEKIFEYLCKYFINKNKPIFIIDDFDRIDRESKQILYNNISNINMFENCLIIVLGDYEKIILENDDIFVQKILNNIEHMPEATESNNIKNYLFDEIEKISLTRNSDDNELVMNRIGDIFIKEKRTLREAKQLLNLFKYNYENKKLKNVNYAEQLAICYIYQFHHKEYNYIKENIDDIYSENLKIDPTDSKDNYQYSIIDLFEENNLNTSYNFVSFIYNTFHNVHYFKFEFPSVTKQVNFPLYKIESSKTSTISNELVYNFIMSDVSEINEFLKFNNDNLNRFFYILKDNYLNRNINQDRQIYISLLEKLSYIFENNFHDTSRYIETLIYETIEHLKIGLELEPRQQYKDIIVPSKIMDVSQKLHLLPKFVPARTEKLRDQQKCLVVETFNNNYIDILKCSKPDIVFIFYTHYYVYIIEYINIDNDLFKIFDLDNEDLAKFINKYFLKLNNFSDNEEKEIRLYDICFNDSFKLQFLSKIDELKSLNLIDENVVVTSENLLNKI
ncbi:P-loop NTPase fold protein [Staphylococcus sp. NRL 16/872]|uniref:P-loop NTPase fold protein n=1 Tax=Staphylococcus sp. NRL 16/872 TaxID=2930131 RepID=UPI001FB45F4F|nr:P-loop NTPase fold protein [Staphylococcus sp. NRL 16/872]MCJ1655333.1 KAP family NTPase [Staphylococcus sp. NRL 21/187]MCJ1667061.1 KAP family NTPase [Staphylococcus sp. NRL 19/737]WEN69536.1 P-loop NTPase fold protein [Staphylococcus sp. NRL 16/872]